MRTCIGCRQPAPAIYLVRVVRSPDGSLQVGPTLPGRGAWLHAGTPQCFLDAARRNAFSRALRAPVSTDAVSALQPLLLG